MSDVLDAVSQFLRKVKRSGSDNIVAVCPFHRKPDGGEEHNPSFSMSLSTGLFFCFTCQEKGTLAGFLSKIGVPRPRIDRDYGRILEQLSFIAPKKDLARFPPIGKAVLPEGVLGLFDRCPIPLLEEGFDEDILQKYDVGFDPAHMRITFPLRDMKGNLVGISGRSVNNDWPKYKVYDKEFVDLGYPLHHTDKGMVLWNFDRVYPNVLYKHKAPVVLVEGFKACLWLIQNGIQDTVASLGVHISDEQHLMLEHLGATVYVMLDNDVWGRRATAKVAKKLSKSLDVRVVEFDSTKAQPSDLTAQEIADAVGSAKDFYFWAMEERNKQWLLERTPQT